MCKKPSCSSQCFPTCRGSINGPILQVRPLYPVPNNSPELNDEGRRTLLPNIHRPTASHISAAPNDTSTSPHLHCSHTRPYLQTFSMLRQPALPTTVSTLPKHSAYSLPIQQRVLVSPPCDPSRLTFIHNKLRFTISSLVQNRGCCMNILCTVSTSHASNVPTLPHYDPTADTIRALPRRLCHSQLHLLQLLVTALPRMFLVSGRYRCQPSRGKSWCSTE